MCVELCRQILFSYRGLPKNYIKSSDKTQITVIPDPDPQEPLHIVLANEAQVDVSMDTVRYPQTISARIARFKVSVEHLNEKISVAETVLVERHKEADDVLRKVQWIYHLGHLSLQAIGISIRMNCFTKLCFSKFICLILFLCTAIFQRTKISDLQGLKNGWCTSISLGINITSLLIMYHMYPNRSTWISHLIMLIANHNTL